MEIRKVPEEYTSNFEIFCALLNGTVLFFCGVNLFDFWL